VASTIVLSLPDVFFSIRYADVSSQILKKKLIIRLVISLYILMYMIDRKRWIKEREENQTIYRVSNGLHGNENKI